MYLRDMPCDFRIQTLCADWWPTRRRAERWPFDWRVYRVCEHVQNRTIHRISASVWGEVWIGYEVSGVGECSSSKGWCWDTTCSGRWPQSESLREDQWLQRCDPPLFWSFRIRLQNELGHRSDAWDTVILIFIYWVVFLKSCRVVCGKVDLVHGIMEQCMKWCILIIPQKFLSRLPGRLLRVDAAWNSEDWKNLSFISSMSSCR